VGSQIIARPTSALEEGQGNSELPSPFVLLVDDNDLNLRLLCAYTKMGNYEYMTAQNGAEAVATYKAHPGKFRLVILGMFEASSCFLVLNLSYFAANADGTRYLNACHGWLRSGPANPPPRERIPSRIG
jgi:CheY-like chemotaxis protein